MFNTCRDAGVNFFDCSNNYSEGKAEEILGRYIRDCRNEVVITTKVSQRIGKDINALGSSRRHIMFSIEQRLSRLKTDRIDLYIVHYFDPATAMDETLRAFNDLVRQGKILYLGVSNWAAWQIAKVPGIQEKNGCARFECIQSTYNLVKRQAEVETFPLAESEHLGVIPYNPLGVGLLAGKYSKDRKPTSGRIAEKEMYNKRYSNPVYYEIAESFTDFARKLGVSPVTQAISWAKSNPAVTAPIIGARNVIQLKDFLAAADFDMSAEMRETITKLSVSPGTATDRLEEELDLKYMLRNRQSI